MDTRSTLDSREMNDSHVFTRSFISREDDTRCLNLFLKFINTIDFKCETCPLVCETVNVLPQLTKKKKKKKERVEFLILFNFLMTSPNNIDTN